VCLSAIADRAIDHAGGVITVFMTKGQLNYNEEFKKVNGINLNKGDDKSNVSFIVAKVDSPLMVGKNVRIINDKGDVSSKGQLEIKLERIWQTLKKSSISNDEIVA